MKRRFLFTILITAAITSLLAGAFFELLSAGLRNAHKDFQGKLNYLINCKEHFDAVFIGSSRVFNQVNPLLFDSILHTNSFNAGIEGARIAELEVFANKFINSHGAPKYLFLSVEESSLLTDHVWDFPRLFPYVNDDDIFGLAKYQHEIYLAKYLPPVALTFYDDSRKSLALQSLVSKPVLICTSDNAKGFIPLPLKPRVTLNAEASEKYWYDNDGLKILTRMCELCKNKNIRLIFIIPPKLIQNNLVDAPLPQSFEKIAQVAALYNIPIVDLSHRTEFANPTLYYDDAHLNANGASIYTRLVSEKFEKLR